MLHTDFSPIQLRLKESGFPLSGAVDFKFALPLYQEHSTRYQKWIEGDLHGSMEYLKRGLDRRLDPRLVFPEIKSVIAVARPYSSQPIEKNGIRYARYLADQDYHTRMKEDLAQVFEGAAFSYKICVDTSAVLERTWATLAGLGWIGKNTLLIHPQLGSYLFIGIIFTSTEFGIEPRLHKDYCGNCNRCIEVCPTEALTEHTLDSKKCISYLTLEKKGPWEEAFNPRGFVAGCDLCQEVCPYNLKISRSPRISESDLKREHLLTDTEQLKNETEFDYKKRVRGTALERIKYGDFRRNLEAVLRHESHKK